MIWQFTPYSGILFVGAVILIGIIGIAWQHRHARGADAIALLAAVIWVYVVGYGLEIGSPTLADIQTWLKVEYIGITLIPLSMFYVIAKYVHWQQHFQPLHYLFLAALPGTTLLFAFTNEFHGFIWQDMYLTTTQAPFLVAFERGPWYWVTIIYTWAFSTLGLLLLIAAHRRLVGIYRRQIRIFIVGILIPLGLYLAYVLHLIPVALDMMPFGRVATGMLLAYAILRHYSLEVLPIAHEAIFRGMSDAALVYDTQERLIDLNPAAQALFQLQPDRAVGLPLLLTLPQWELLRVNHPANEFITLTIHNEPHSFRVRHSPLQDYRGRYHADLLVLHDVTTLQQTEQTLRDTNQHATQLIEELDAFAHTVAHDLKNPLSVINGYVALLLESPNLSPDEHDFVETIQRSVEKSFSIIQALMLLAGVRSQQTMQIEPIKMVAILNEVLQRLGPYLEEQQAQLTIDNDFPAVLGYAPWVEEIWVNYLTNAVKYGGHPPEIHITYAHLADGRVRFEVRDNGQGIAPDDQEQLFRPFTRLHTAKIEGHGLGLSVVRRIAEQLNGEVGVESKIGAGSRFYFILPATEHVNGQERPAPRATSSEDQNNITSFF